MIAGLLSKSFIKASFRELRTLQSMKLKKMHSLIILEDSLVNRGKLRQLRKYVTWCALQDSAYATLGRHFKKKALDLRKNLVLGLNSPYKGYPEKIKRTGQLDNQQFNLYLQRCVYRTRAKNPQKITADVV